MGVFSDLLGRIKYVIDGRKEGESLGAFVYRKIMYEDVLIDQFFTPSFKKVPGSDIEVILFISALVHNNIHNEYSHTEYSFMPEWYAAAKNDIENRGLLDLLKKGIPEIAVQLRIDYYRQEWDKIEKAGINFYASHACKAFYHKPLESDTAFLVQDFFAVKQIIIPAVFRVSAMVDGTIKNYVK